MRILSWQIPSPVSSLVILSTSGLFSLSLCTGCADRIARQEKADEQPVVGQVTPAGAQIPASSTSGTSGTSGDPRDSTLGMNARLQALEAKISALNEKLDSMRATLDGFSAAHAPIQAVGVPSRASDTVGIPASPSSAATDPESGFIHDDAVQQYRKAEILLETRKYAEAIRAFGEFLEKYPDHVMAGSAQFHIGQAYYDQKKYKEAAEELQKVLTSYDRSVHVADTLRVLASAEDHLGKETAASRHRQQLGSLFASSPSATAVQSQSSDAPPPSNPPGAVAAPPASENDSAPPAPPMHDLAPAKPGLDEPPSAPVTAPMNDTSPAVERTPNE